MAEFDPNGDNSVPKLVSSLHSFSLTPMFHFLSRIISPSTPKLLFLHIHPWLSMKFVSTTSKGNSFTVSYLIHNCGFSPERAALISKHVNFETREKSDSLIEFFKNHGFSQTQLLNVIATAPWVLKSNPEKTILPKIEFFKSKGFSNSDIPYIVTGCPHILGTSLHKEIVPSFGFFNNMFQSKDKFMKAIIRCLGILYGLGLRSAPNIKLLREEGVSESHITRLIEYYPATLKVAPKRFKEIVEEVKELGFNPLRLQFVVAIQVKKCLSKSTWAKKEGIYRSWGWTDDYIRAAFRSFPFSMMVSENKIEAVMHFLVNKLGYKSSAIARCPVVLSMSLGKRIIPRGSVIQVLMSKGLVNQLNLNAIYKSSEKVFLEKFISCHEREADELLKLYQAKLAIPG